MPVFVRLCQALPCGAPHTQPGSPTAPHGTQALKLTFRVYRRLVFLPLPLLSSSFPFLFPLLPSPSSSLFVLPLPLLSPYQQPTFTEFHVATSWLSGLGASLEQLCHWPVPRAWTGADTRTATVGSLALGKALAVKGHAGQSFAAPQRKKAGSSSATGRCLEPGQELTHAQRQWPPWHWTTLWQSGAMPAKASQPRRGRRSSATGRCLVPRRELHTQKPSPGRGPGPGRGRTRARRQLRPGKSSSLHRNPKADL